MQSHDNRAWYLLSPALAIMAFVAVLPLMAVINYSFLDVFTLQQTFWVGTDWYEEIASSPGFYASLARSGIFTIITLAIQVPLGVGIALLIRRCPRLAPIMLAIVAVPLVVPWNMIPMIWLSYINTKSGIAGQAIQAAGLVFDYKFTAPHTWLLILAMDTWHWTGLFVVMAYAGLSTIPEAFYRAAAIDAASRLAVFRHVEWPRILSSLTIVLLLRIVDSLMIHTEAFGINAGGPQGATSFLSLELAEQIKGFSYGPAAARAVVHFLLVLTIVWTFVKVIEARRNPKAIA